MIVFDPTLAHNLQTKTEIQSRTPQSAKKILKKATEPK